ncbi:MAG: hypothetical protein ACK2TT_09995 [Anaerolineales bacterium]|jgi:hypothetical protein
MKKVTLVVVAIVIAAGLAGCGSAPESPAGESLAATLTPTPESTLSPQERYPTSGVISQWVLSAEASSEFADPEWSAAQAVGRPDSPGCGDYQLAWASAPSDSIETLELTFEVGVFPLEITIYESFNPDQVVKVEVYNPETGGYYTVLQKNPTPIERPCPYQLTVPVEGIEFRTDRVRITVDQSQLGLGWNEIDAVELVGAISLPESGD